MAAAATAKGSQSDGTGGGTSNVDAFREELYSLPFGYLPSVGALLLLLVAVGAHVLLLLGKQWSVKFHAW